MWSKIGNIFNQCHAQLPIADLRNEFIRVYFSTRKGHKSFPVYIDLDLEHPENVLRIDLNPILEIGDRGYFDSSGIMPTAIVTIDMHTKYLYYIGWSQRKDVPYHNTLGLAISEDGGLTWKKFSKGPVFGTSYKEPGFIGAAEVKIIGDKWIMFYLSCREWIEFEGFLEPIYDIKVAESLDGVDWEPLDKTAISLNYDEGGITSPRIRKLNLGYEMIFCVRKKKDYRTKSVNSYRIKSAFSQDLLNWQRLEGTIIPTSNIGFDDFMTCYPFYFNTNNNEYLLYNGNGFGGTGIGLAKWIAK